MKVGIDICRLTDRWTGVGNYIYNLLLGLAEVDRKNQYVLYPYFWDCFPRDFKALAEYLPDSPNFRLHGLNKSEIMVKLLWCKLKLPKEPQLEPVDVTHSTNLAGPRLKKSKLVVTVHDLSFEREPSWHKKSNVTFSNNALAAALKNADLFIAPSRFTADELEDLHPETRGRVRVAPEAVQPRFAPSGATARLDDLRAKYGLKRPFFLYVGTLEPRKNLMRLLRAFNQALNLGLRDFNLVLAGGKGWKSDEIIGLIKKMQEKGRVQWLGYVPAEDLPLLYQAAEVMVYPSLYEGFGLPVLEAMASGTPVITARAASLTEVAGDAGMLVDPLSEEELTAALMRLADDDGLRCDLAEKGLARSAVFSRANMGASTLEVYRELAC